MPNECELPKGVKKIAVKKGEVSDECMKLWEKKGIDVHHLEDSGDDE